MAGKSTDNRLCRSAAALIGSPGPSDAEGEPFSMSTQTHTTRRITRLAGNGMGDTAVPFVSALAT
jgi:hypothetical protein